MKNLFKFIDNDTDLDAANLNDLLIFDVIIKTQTDFELLLASPTWYNASSVAFVGNGGALRFEPGEQFDWEVKIPPNVKQIYGFNSAGINICNSNGVTANGLWYETCPSDQVYCIKNLTVLMELGREEHIVYNAFKNCTNLTNCSANVFSYASGNLHGYTYGFNHCTNLTDCKASVTGGYEGCGFTECTNLVNCNGTGGTSHRDILYDIGYGFRNCKNLIGCTGYASDSHYSFGFYDCIQLVNCTGKGEGGYRDIRYYGYRGGFGSCSQLINCIGIGDGSADGYAGYGFMDCSQIFGCTGMGTSISENYGGYESSGFMECSQISDSIGLGVASADSSGSGFSYCKQLSNCQGSGTGAYGYGFESCSWVNGCKQGSVASTTSFTHGTMRYVDNATLAAT